MFYTQTSHDYLWGILKAFASIWMNHREAYLVDLPAEICWHLLNVECPSDHTFRYLEEIFGKRFVEEIRMMREIESIEAEERVKVIKNILRLWYPAKCSY